jgi:hypothetical protein
MVGRLAAAGLLLVCSGCRHSKILITAQQRTALQYSTPALIERLQGPDGFALLEAATTSSEPLKLRRVETELTVTTLKAVRRRVSGPRLTVDTAQSLGALAQQWFAQLQNGVIQYHVPGTMLWKVASTVTVVIQGPQAPASTSLRNATGSATIKVSDRMKVVISCPDNPDEFSIDREQGTDEIQFVPPDGSTTWNWSVTPKYTGRSQKLSIAAWVLYPGQDDKVLRALPVYSATVDVDVPGFGESFKRLLEGDPDYWLHYGLPGGGGFIFFAGVVGAILKRNSNRKKKNHNTHPGKPH